MPIIFNTIPAAEKAIIYRDISNKTRMPAFAVEKDWWVVQALTAVFEMEVAAHLVFKSGTSLSKAWKLIDRFSEDIDLAIDREFLGFTGELSKNQRTELRKAAGSYVAEAFLPELEARFAAKGFTDLNFHLVPAKDSDQDPRIIELYYPNVIPSPGYLEPRVQIEIGCRSLREPFTVQTFGSLVDDMYADKNFDEAPIHIPTVNPERTFLEKVFLLHEEFGKPLHKVRVDRLSRHLYDVVKLTQAGMADAALANSSLYETIVEHRYKFTRISGVNYNLHQPQTINPIPRAEIIEAWKADYKTMVEQMIYEETPPSFEEIITDLSALKERMNALPWTMAKELTSTFVKPI